LINPTETQSPQSATPVPGSEVLGRPVADPVSGLPWAVRTYDSTAGGDCVELARVQDGQFGRLDDDETFHELGPDSGGTCGDLQSEPLILAINTYPATGKRSARTVVFGTSNATVASVAIARSDGPTARPAIDSARAFVLPIEGIVDATALPVTVTLRDGRSISYDW
jgi:hypothetical protein